MPGKRRHRPQPENDFFNELLDSVMDTVLDTVEPYIDRMAKEAVTNARRIVSQGQTDYVPPQPRTRQRTAQPPPPPPKPSPHPVITLYDVLEVSPRASTETIEAAYKSLAKRFHPDKNNDGKAEERMKQINHAYGVLKDPDKRKLYNRQAQI